MRVYCAGVAVSSTKWEVCQSARNETLPTLNFYCFTILSIEVFQCRHCEVKKVELSSLYLENSFIIVLFYVFSLPILSWPANHQQFNWFGGMSTK